MVCFPVSNNILVLYCYHFFLVLLLAIRLNSCPTKINSKTLVSLKMVWDRKRKLPYLLDLKTVSPPPPTPPPATLKSGGGTLLEVSMRQPGIGSCCGSSSSPNPGLELEPQLLPSPCHLCSLHCSSLAA